MGKGEKMRVIIQRVKQASVVINQKEKAAINEGLLLLVAFTSGDTSQDVEYMVRKIIHMRIFSGEDGKMNHSIKDIGGEILSISQFTLYAQTRKGNRPSFIEAAKPDMALALYEQFNHQLNEQVPTKTGEFGADMKVHLLNDGPVTIFIDSQDKQ